MTWLHRMVESAYNLGLGGRLHDPSDDDVLIYSAEDLGDSTTDLAKLDPLVRRTIIDAYDRGTGL